MINVNELNKGDKVLFNDLEHVELGDWDIKIGIEYTVRHITEDGDLILDIKNIRDEFFYVENNELLYVIKSEKYKIEDNNVYNMDAIDFLEQLYINKGEKSIDLFLVDFPYTYKGKARVTANKWDLPVDIEKFFKIASKLLTDNGVIALTATNPFASYLISNNLDMFKYEWIWEKDNGSNFTHVKYQPFKVHEQVLIFGKSATTYVKSGKNMKYNPQMIAGEPYKVKRSGMTSNLASSKEYKRTDGENNGVRYPRSIQKFNMEKGLHPTQKPVSLFQYLIETYTDENMTIVDCCAGSGTTAIACMNSNRNFIVNDKDGEYYNLIQDRISKNKNVMKGSC